MIHLLLLLALAAADERKLVRVKCPVDGARFSAYDVVRTNKWGGIDRDWCAHAFKTRPIDHHVWVCPKCAFAGTKKEFESETEIPEDARARLRKELKPAVPIPKGAKQKEIAGHVKFDLLAQVHALRGDGDLKIGMAYLRASWAVRQSGASDLPDFDEWTRLKERYGLTKTPMQIGLGKNRSPYDLEKARKLAGDMADKYKSGTSRVLALYLAAYLNRKHGENREALGWLEKLKELKGQNSFVDNAAKRMAESIELERRYQEKAAAFFERALDGELEKKARGELLYMMGELHRRLDRADTALAWYDKCIEAASGGMQKLAAEQRALLKP